MSILRAYYTDLTTAAAIQIALDSYVSTDPNFWISTHRNDNHLLALISGDADDHAYFAAWDGVTDSGVSDIRTDTQLDISNFDTATAISAYPDLVASDFAPALDIGDAITVIMRHLQPGCAALSYDNTPMPSGTFSDDFTGTDGDALEDRTGWTLALDGAYGAEIYNNALLFNTGGGGSGTSYWLGTDQESVNQYAQAVDERFALSLNGSLWLCCPLVGADNYVGYHCPGTGAAGARFGKVVSGTLTDSIIATQGAAGYSYKIEREGTTYRFYRDTGSGFAQVGSDQTISDSIFTSATRAGFLTDVNTTEVKWDNFENGTVGGVLPINCTTGALIVQSVNAVIVNTTPILATTGALNIAALSASVSTGVIVTATTGAVTITNINPAVSIGKSFISSTGALTISGFNPSISFGSVIEATSGNLTITGINPALSVTTSITSTLGAITIVGVSPSVSNPVDVSATTGTLSIVGYDPSVIITTALISSTGALTIVSNNPTIDTTVAIESTTGVITILGIDTSISLTKSIDATLGAIVINGLDFRLTTGVIGAPSNERIYVVGHENRIYVVPFEDRIYTIN